MLRISAVFAVESCICPSDSSSVRHSPVMCRRLLVKIHSPLITPTSRFFCN